MHNKKQCLKRHVFIEGVIGIYDKNRNKVFENHIKLVKISTNLLNLFLKVMATSKKKGNLI